MIKDLALEFNSINNIKFNDKSINIIFAHWLKRFIKICYDRYHLLKSAFKNNRLKKLKLIDTGDFGFCTKETSGIIFASLDSYWNYTLISKMINFFSMGNYSTTKILRNRVNNIDFVMNKYVNKKSNNYKLWIKNSLNYLNFLRNKDDAVFHLSYFPFLKEKEMEIRLKQIPSYWDFSYEIKSKYNIEKRKEINLRNNNLINLENFIRMMIPLSLPISLIEDFENLVKLSDNFPQNPKFIFSSVSFDMNDLFKVYSATKAKNGTKIIAGQHGNGSFSFPDSKYIPEYNFSDYYLTWGNKDKKFFFPLFNYKVLSKKNQK